MKVELWKCEYQINRIVNNIKQCKNSIYVTKEEQKILQEYIEKIYMGQQQCYGKYHIYSKDNQEKLLELEKELKAVGYEIFDILNDMLLGKITVYQKEILIEKLKLVEKFLNMWNKKKIRRKNNIINTSH